MNRLAYRAMAIVLCLLIFGCAAPAGPTVAPAPPSKAAPTAPPAPASKAAPTAPPGPASKAEPGAKPKSAFSFAGKTVTILIGFSPGGDADITARQVAPFLSKYLPGNPTVVVQNMPGASGLVGDNWLYNVAPKDGTFIGQPSTAFANALFSPDQTKYDLAKLRWLGGFADTSVLFSRNDLGVKSGEELPKATQKLFIGVTVVGTQRDMPIVFFMKLLGLDTEIVAGYGSAGDQRTAVLRGEVHVTAGSLPSYYSTVRPLVEQGQLVALAQGGILQDGKVVRDPRVADIPTYSDVLVKVKGEAVRQTPEFRAMELITSINGLPRGWVYPPGVPEEAIAATAAAFEKILADPEFVQDFEKSVGYKPVTHNATRAQQVAAAIVDGFNKNPDALELIRKVARES